MHAIRVGLHLLLHDEDPPRARMWEWEMSNLMSKVRVADQAYQAEQQQRLREITLGVIRQFQHRLHCRRAHEAPARRLVFDEDVQKYVREARPRRPVSEIPRLARLNEIARRDVRMPLRVAVSVSEALAQDPCPVCSNKLEVLEDAVMLPCGHAFRAECLEHCYENGVYCPECGPDEDE